MLPERRFPETGCPREKFKDGIPSFGGIRKCARGDAVRHMGIVFSLTGRDGSLCCPMIDVPWSRRFPRRTIIHLLERARDSPVRAGKGAFESQAGSARAASPVGALLAPAILNCRRDAMLVGRGAMLIGGKSQTAHERSERKILIWISN